MLIIMQTEKSYVILFLNIIAQKIALIMCVADFEAIGGNALDE